MKGSVRKRGTTWRYSFDLGIVDGKRKRKERSGFRTKADALKALNQAVYEHENAGNTVDENNISVSDYFDFWYKNYVLTNCKLNTQRYYSNIINNHIKPYMGIYKLKSIKPSTIQDFFNDKFNNGYGKSSLSNMYGVLSSAFKMAIHPYQYIKTNPVSYIKLPKFDEKPSNRDDLKIITYNDFKRIIERFPNGSSFYIPLQIAYHTGMRGGEVCALTWDCIDIENKNIIVEKTLISKGRGLFETGTPKTKSSYRTIQIGETLCSILKSHLKDQKLNQLKYGEYYTHSNYVCTKENGELVTTDSLKYLSRVINYELMINFNFHSLRHTHATLLIESGANIKDVQKRLGHSKIATTMDTYTHVTAKMQNNTVNIFEKTLSILNNSADICIIASAICRL